MRYVLLIFLIISNLAAAPASAAETNILLGQDYFQTTHQAIQEANSQVASKRRETGFHDISQTILLLKGLKTEN